MKIIVSLLFGFLVAALIAVGMALFDTLQPAIGTIGSMGVALLLSVVAAVVAIWIHGE